MSDHSSLKRSHSDVSSSSATAKRPRIDQTNAESSTALVRAPSASAADSHSLVLSHSSGSVPTRDRLTYSLSGHSGSINTVRFSPTGEYLISGGADRKLFLWKLGRFADSHLFSDFSSEFLCLSSLSGHRSAIQHLEWNRDGSIFFSASADCRAAQWDVEVGKRVRQFKGHQKSVNCIARARAEFSVERRKDFENRSSLDPFAFDSESPCNLVTASDDASVLLWDSRVRRYSDRLVHPLEVPVTSVVQLNELIWFGGIDNRILCHDTRSGRIIYQLSGHSNTITSLALHPEGTHLLSNSMDSSIISWDIRPFTAGSRQSAVYHGLFHQPSDLALIQTRWSPDGRHFVSGSCDRRAGIFDSLTGQLVASLGGHGGAVTAVDWSPILESPVVATAGADKTIIIGEI